jgi:hypothetical protein
MLPGRLYRERGGEGKEAKHCHAGAKRSISGWQGVIPLPQWERPGEGEMLMKIKDIVSFCKRDYPTQSRREDEIMIILEHCPRGQRRSQNIKLSKIDLYFILDYSNFNF